MMSAKPAAAFDIFHLSRKSSSFLVRGEPSRRAGSSLPGLAPSRFHDRSLIQKLHVRHHVGLFLRREEEGWGTIGRYAKDDGEEAVVMLRHVLERLG